MELPNEIVLRPRFSLEFWVLPEIILAAFENAGKVQKEFVISRSDDHVFIRLPKAQQNIWSPQLHLEIYKVEEESTILRGLYGPNPTLWTLFMFLHFVIATLFVGSAIWIYINSTLGSPVLIPIIAMVVLIVIWFALYFAGRWGRRTGKKEMLMLRDFMNGVLRNFN